MCHYNHNIEEKQRVFFPKKGYFSGFLDNSTRYRSHIFSKVLDIVKFFRKIVLSMFLAKMDLHNFPLVFRL